MCRGTKYYIVETDNFRIWTNLQRHRIINITGPAVDKHIFNCSKDSVDGKESFRSKKKKNRIMPFYTMNNDNSDFRRRK